MSESYVINEKRELILDRVKEFIYQNGGVVKKNWGSITGGFWILWKREI